MSLVSLQVAILGGADDEIQEVAFQYGRNVGMAFQLMDDLLDFVSSSNLMGKPAAADLRLGLATAPVLFACEKVRAHSAPSVGVCWGVGFTNAIGGDSWVE